MGIYKNHTRQRVIHNPTTFGPQMKLKEKRVYTLCAYRPTAQQLGHTPLKAYVLKVNLHPRD